MLTFSSLFHKYGYLLFVPVEDNELFDFRGFRLDWFRLQVCMMIMMISCVVHGDADNDDDNDNDNDNDNADRPSKAWNRIEHIPCHLVGHHELDVHDILS